MVLAHVELRQDQDAEDDRPAPQTADGAKATQRPPLPFRPKIQTLPQGAIHQTQMAVQAHRYLNHRGVVLILLASKIAVPAA